MALQFKFFKKKNLLCFFIKRDHRTIYFRYLDIGNVTIQNSTKQVTTFEKKPIKTIF